MPAPQLDLDGDVLVPLRLGLVDAEVGHDAVAAVAEHAPVLPPLSGAGGRAALLEEPPDLFQAVQCHLVFAAEIDIRLVVEDIVKLRAIALLDYARVNDKLTTIRRFPGPAQARHRPGAGNPPVGPILIGETGGLGAERK